MESEKIEYVLTTRARNLTLLNKLVRRNIANAVGMEDRSVAEILRTNKPNNSLTLAAGIEAISKETGLSQEEIIEPVKAIAA